MCKIQLECGESNFFSYFISSTSNHGIGFVFIVPSMSHKNSIYHDMLNSHYLRPSKKAVNYRDSDESGDKRDDIDKDKTYTSPAYINVSTPTMSAQKAGASSRQIVTEARREANYNINKNNPTILDNSMIVDEVIVLRDDDTSYKSEMLKEMSPPKKIVDGREQFGGSEDVLFARRAEVFLSGLFDFTIYANSKNVDV